MKKVIVVGATSGIGRALALLYVKNGCTVGITGRRDHLLESLQRESAPFLTTGNQVFTAAFDVTGDENIQELQKLVARMGGLDLLIYNAGFGDPSETLEWAIDRKTVAINVNGFIEISNWAYHFFMLQGSGQLAATSSIASNRGNSFAPAYSASKAFISCYLEGLHYKLKKLHAGVLVTDIQPGFVKTKEINIKGQFWVVPLPKAAAQIFAGLEAGRFRVYVSKRWWLVAKLMRMAPRFIYGKIA